MMVKTGKGKINPRELCRMLVDPRADDFELKRLLLIDEGSCNSFEPINEAQIRLVENVEFGGRVFHVDCRNAVGDDNWSDELYPNNTGFQVDGKRFEQKIKEITGRR